MSWKTWEFRFFIKLNIKDEPGSAKKVRQSVIEHFQSHVLRYCQESKKQTTDGHLKPEKRTDTYIRLLKNNDSRSDVSSPTYGLKFRGGSLGMGRLECKELLEVNCLCEKWEKKVFLAKRKKRKVQAGKTCCFASDREKGIVKKNDSRSKGKIVMKESEHRGDTTSSAKRSEEIVENFIRAWKHNDDNFKALLLENDNIVIERILVEKSRQNFALPQKRDKSILFSIPQTTVEPVGFIEIGMVQVKKETGSDQVKSHSDQVNSLCTQNNLEVGQMDSDASRSSVIGMATPKKKKDFSSVIVLATPEKKKDCSSSDIHELVKGEDASWFTICVESQDKDFVLRYVRESKFHEVLENAKQCHLDGIVIGGYPHFLQEIFK
eukprot:g3865.t1